MSYIVLDIECSKKPIFKPWHEGSFLSSVCIEDEEGNSKVWFFNPLVGDDTEHLKEIREIISKANLIVGHNIKFDATWLLSIGIDLKDKFLFCTQVAEYLVSGQKNSQRCGYDLNLDAVCARYGFPLKLDAMKAYWDSGINTDEIPLTIHEEYVKQDAHITHMLFKKHVEVIKELNLTTLASLCFYVTKILSYMEYNGLPFDKQYAIELKDTFSVSMEEMDKTLLDIAKVNFSPDSSQQLSAVLYGGSWKIDGRETYEVTLKSGEVKQKSRKCKVDKEYSGLGFTPTEDALRTKTGIPSTGKEVLEGLYAKDETQKTFLTTLLNRRKLSKALSTLWGKNEDAGYISKLGTDKRLHPQFNQTVTVTGRLSSSEPNGQNLPRGSTSPIKTCIIPSYDKIMNVDFAQIEWRMAAALSGDPVMIEETIAGVDVHAKNAVALFGVSPDQPDFKKYRQAAKTITFRLLYGGSAYAFFKDQNMPHLPLEAWEKIVNDFYTKYSKLKEWQNDNYKSVVRDGFLRSPSGRILTYDKVQFKDGSWGYNRAQICNYSVQSIAADLMFMAMMHTFNFIKSNNLKTKMLLVVHDSVVLDVPEEEIEIIKDNVLTIFSSVPIYIKEYFGWDIPVPIMGDCSIGENYGAV